MKIFQKHRQRRLLRLAVILVAIVMIFSIGLTSAMHYANALSAITEKGFKSDYNTREEVSAASQRVNEELMQEGAVLLKNEGNALPLTGDAPRVTLFGKNTTNPVYAGTGSSAQGGVNTYYNLIDSLKLDGFDVNPVMEPFYRNNTVSGPVRAGGRTGETRATGTVSGWGNLATPPAEDMAYDPTNTTPGYSNYETVRSSYAKYNDAAIVQFTRTGGEGDDVPRTMGTGTYSDGTNIQQGARARDDHYMQLDLNETNLLKEACEYFDTVIVVINSASAIECGFLDDPTHYAYNANIKAALWIGTPGENGFRAVGKILNGTVNPSGGLVDHYSRNFKNDPVWSNFGKMEPFNQNSNRYNEEGGSNIYAYFVEYQEGIYLGYRYYETKYSDMLKLENAAGPINIGDAEAWYKANVVRPFGFGLSYTTFNWEVVERKLDGGAFADNAALNNIKGDSKFTIDVKVTNTGNRAGKDTVEIYAEAPYTPGGIEKSKVLVGFSKTRLLQPGESQTLQVNVLAYHLASFDVYDKNANLFYGYELEAGAYKLQVSTDSHNVKSSVNFTIGTEYGLKIDKDPVTGKTIELLYPESNAYFVDSNKVIYPNAANQPATALPLATLLSRNGNFANVGDITDASENTKRRAISKELRFEIGNTETGATTIGSGSDVANTSSTDHDWGTGTSALVNHFERLFYDTRAPLITESYDTKYPGAHPVARKSYEETPYKFYDMWDFTYDDPRWDTVINGLTWAQIAELVGSGMYGNVQIDSLGKPAVPDHDGPVGWTSTEMGNGMRVGELKMVSTCIVAATFNRELAQKLGEAIGEEGIWGYYQNTNAARVAGSSFSGWYAPGANIHRSAFSGRNFEYMSEDGHLSGKMMGAVVIGAQNKGVYSYMKHFFMNDQEKNRSVGNDSRGLVTWADEQTMREIYARAFEIAVKDANENNPDLVGIMSAYNRIGVRWVAGDYNSMVKLLRGEWGFKGLTISDHIGDQAYQQTERIIFGGYTKVLRANRRPVIKDEILNFVGSATLPADVPATSPFAKNFVANAPIGNTYKYALRQAVKEVLYVTSKSNSNNTAQLVSVTAVNINTANNNADGIARLFNVGDKINYNLQTDTAVAYRPYVNFGDREDVVYTYAVAPGYEFPEGMSVLKDGTIMGVAKTPTLSWSSSNGGSYRSGAAVVGAVNIFADGYIAGFQAVSMRINGPVDAPLDGSKTMDFTGKFLGTADFDKTFSAQVKAFPLVANERQLVYSLKNSALPNGLVLFADGTITGKVTGSECYTATFVVEVKVFSTDLDASGNKTATYGDIVDSMEAVFTIAVGRQSITQSTVQELIADAVSDKLNQTQVNALISAATNGLLNETQVKAIVAANENGYQTAANVATIIAANTNGYLTNSTATTLINGLIAGKLDMAQVKAIIAQNENGYLTNSTTTTLINGLIAGKLDTAQVKAIIAANENGYQTAANVAAIITANTDGYLTTATATTLINSLITGKLDAAQVQALIDSAVANKLTEAQVNALIDEAIEANSGEGGCNGMIAGTSIGFILAFIGVGAIIVIKRRKSEN